MKTILYPPEDTWDDLCKRPATNLSASDISIRNIIDRVRNEGDKALIELTKQYDGATLTDIKVTQTEIDESVNLVSDDLKNAINIAAENIRKFHKDQLPREAIIETLPGVRCWRKNVAIEKVGLYIPGGTAPLFSTVLMLAIPAKIAGCGRIILCTPPSENGNINPLILYTAWLTGIREIFRIGGSQAIAAMAYGTESVPKIYKIFGPGNRYVTRAKEIVQSDGVAIDLPAGPSEVLIIADSQADPEFIAADLLSQAEHGPDSQVLFLTDKEELLDSVRKETERQLAVLPRHDIAASALVNSIFLLLPDLEACTNFSNKYAPEHLIINTSDPGIITEKIINAGSVFLGKYSCESAGDYASGTNHTLPTNGFTRSYSGVSVESFIKKITFQELSRKGIEKIGPVIELMAEAEQLSAHKNAVSVRLKNLKDVWFR